MPEPTKRASQLNPAIRAPGSTRRPDGTEADNLCGRAIRSVSLVDLRAVDLAIVASIAHHAARVQETFSMGPSPHRELLGRGSATPVAGPCQPALSPAMNLDSST